MINKKKRNNRKSYDPVSCWSIERYEAAHTVLMTSVCREHCFLVFAT